MINWKTIEKNGNPKNPPEINRPYIPCLVYACNPKVAPLGGVVEVCRWDVKKSEWLHSDVKRNWYLSDPYVITHYSDDYNKPRLIFI